MHKLWHNRSSCNPYFGRCGGLPKKASCSLRRGSREMRDTQAGIRAKRFWENALSKTNSGANSKGVILAPTHNDLKASFTKAICHRAEGILDSSAKVQDTKTLSEPIQHLKNPARSRRKNVQSREVSPIAPIFDSLF